MTYTYVRYFDDEQVTPLHRAIDSLRRDFDRRRAGVGDDTRLAVDRRLALLANAALLLTEPVPRPWE